jgi:hypothetical protein
MVYSFDLGPRDFSFFSSLKDKMRGLRFSSHDGAVESFRNPISQEI